MINDLPHRSSHHRCSIKKGVLKNFAKFTGKNICTRFCNLIKKETLAEVFSCEICEIFKNIFLTEHLQTTASVPLDTRSETWQLLSLLELNYTVSIFMKHSELYHLSVLLNSCSGIIWCIFFSTTLVVINRPTWHTFSRVLSNFKKLLTMRSF